MATATSISRGSSSSSIARAKWNQTLKNANLNLDINARALLSDFYEQNSEKPASQTQQRVFLRITVPRFNLIRSDVTTMQVAAGSPYPIDDPRPDDVMRLLIRVAATKGTGEDEATLQRYDECFRKMLSSMAKSE